MENPRNKRLALRRDLALALLSLSACGGGTGNGPQSADASTQRPELDGASSSQRSDAQASARYDKCTVAADCAWGEIDHEIAERKDCICLYGCPWLALSHETVTRRIAQHEKYCDASKDGNGNPCGIDDCAPRGALACEAMTCAAAP